MILIDPKKNISLTLNWIVRQQDNGCWVWKLVNTKRKFNYD